MSNHLKICTRQQTIHKIQIQLHAPHCPFSSHPSLCAVTATFSSASVQDVFFSSFTLCRVTATFSSASVQDVFFSIFIGQREVIQRSFRGVMKASKMLWESSTLKCGPPLRQAHGPLWEWDYPKHTSMSAGMSTISLATRINRFNNTLNLVPSLPPLDTSSGQRGTHASLPSLVISFDIQVPNDTGQISYVSI